MTTTEFALRKSSMQVNYSLDDTAPLIPKRNLVAQAILEGPIKHHQAIDRYKYPRRITQGVCVIISACAKVPYIPIALLLPGGPFFAFANTFSFFNLEYWAINATTKELMGPKGEYEIILLSRNGRGKYYQVATITASVIIALISQIPVGLPALDYDAQYKVPGFIILLGAGALLPLRSVQLSINKTVQMQKCVLGQVGNKIELIRAEMISLVHEYQEVFRQMWYEDKLQLISTATAHKVEGELSPSLARLAQLSSVVPRTAQICT